MILIFDYFLLLGWSLEQIAALGVSVAAGLGVIGFMALVRLADQDRARSLGFATPAPPQAVLPALPKRVPGAALVPAGSAHDSFDQDTEREIDRTLRIVAPLDEPAAYAAEVRDFNGETWHRVTPPGRPGVWQNDHGVTVTWTTLVERHPRLMDAGATDDPRLQLADDSIPLADIQVDDLDFVAAVLADIDDEFRTDQEADQ